MTCEKDKDIILDILTKESLWFYTEVSGNPSKKFSSSRILISLYRGKLQ